MVGMHAYFKLLLSTVDLYPEMPLCKEYRADGPLSKTRVHLLNRFVKNCTHLSLHIISLNECK